MGYFGDVIDAPWMAGSAGAQPRGYFGALRDPQFYRDVAGNAAGLLGVPLPSEREGMAMLAADPRMQARDVNVARMMTSPGEQAQLAQGWDDKMNALGLLGLTVYHGSPHKFDKFDSAHIGKGEGAQAYGHGLYFAENPGVAKSYQESLATGRPVGLPQGAIDAQLEDAVRQVATIKDYIAKHGSDKGTQALLKDAERSVKRLSSVEGHLYKVDLPDEMIGKMLDWDKPLSQQPESVRLMAKDLGIAAEASFDGIKARALAAGMSESQAVKYARQQAYEPTGAHVYRALAQQMRDGAIARGQNASTTMEKSQDAASAALRDLGIPGIKYLDAGSRTAGEGSRNFVVFPGNEGLLTIKGRQ